MELLSYWPTREYINQCIRTEAEELSEHNLLAVHEPMRLRRVGLSEIMNSTDEKLLEDFLQVERPIPIIGRSGVGKSHLIRWLHAKLRVHPEAAEWHIVRIPKNASLRQVLELLLAGLDGEAFEQARQRVKSVGEQLDTQEVAQLLLTFMGQQLRRLYDKSLVTIEQYRQLGTKPDENEKIRLYAIKEHCGESGLSALINDPYFQTYLLKKEHCIFQFASRLTSGASDDELSDNDYQIHAVDLDMKYNLADLSIPGRRYVQASRLTTNEVKRQEAAVMLNKVLGEATRTAFQQLFQFGGSNFQELFKQIRRDLFEKGQTLVVLVEDMAAISAIEDVLIDSLLEEGLYDGVETMCSLRSAIAVTDGYSGYQRRQDTVRTRAGAEWWIDESQEGEGEQSLVQRIIDFCSRYINASRHGSQALLKSWDNRGENPWPQIWQDKEVDRQYLDAFGQARTGVPLYPLSPSAIHALVDKHCRDAQGQMRFNPRLVIKQILLAILRDCRMDVEQKLFPPVMLARIYAPGNLRSELAQLGLADQGRCESLSAIWGYGANDLAELKKKLSADIALSFGLTDLAGYLQGGVVDLKPTPEPEVKTPGVPLPDKLPQTDPEEQKLKALLTEVDLWCQRKKDFPQNEANILRKALAVMYQTYARKEWISMGELPSIKTGTFVNITLPYAIGNRSGILLEFCSEKDFTDQDKSILFHDAARAMLRYNHHNSKKNEEKGWDYPLGHEDFLHYQNFAARWVPGVLFILRDNEREKLNAFMSDQVATAQLLAIFKESDNHRERLNKLLQSQKTLIDAFPPPVCETVLTERQVQLAQWELLQKKWQKLLASNDHGLEGDLAFSALKMAMRAPLPNKINRVVTRARCELEQESVNILVTLFADCESVDAFNQALENLEILIKQLRTAGKYPTNSAVVTSHTLLPKIKGLTEKGHFEQVRKFLSITTNSDVGQQWQILNELDGDKVKLILKGLNSWQTVFDIALPNLKNENSIWGGERVTEAKATINSLLESLDTTLKCVQGDSDGNA